MPRKTTSTALRSLTSLGNPLWPTTMPLTPQAPPAVVACGVNSAASFPLKIGRVTLGIVGLTSGEKHHFTPERVQLLAAIASELGVLVENARLDAESEGRLEELHAAVHRFRGA